jgi:hypothetical protein
LNNTGATLVKVALMAGGAVLGTLLARWCDELLASHTEKQSEQDRTRYAQGLGPLAPQPPLEEQEYQ